MRVLPRALCVFLNIILASTALVNSYSFDFQFIGFVVIVQIWEIVPKLTDV